MKNVSIPVKHGPGLSQLIKKNMINNINIISTEQIKEHNKHYNKIHSEEIKEYKNIIMK